MNKRIVDVLMDPTTGDLPAFTEITAGPKVIAQRCKIRLSTHRGDWPLKIQEGIRWIEILGKKPVDLEALTATIAVELKTVPGVTRVTDLDWAYGVDKQEAQISALVHTEDKHEIRVVVDPFGIDGNPSIVVGGTIGGSGSIL